MVDMPSNSTQPIAQSAGAVKYIDCTPTES